jgi:membrane protease YdiL (CAAX protease family)
MKRYKDTPWWWYTIIMGIAFVFGLVVVLKSNVGLGAGGFVAALAVGAVIAPFVSENIWRPSKTPKIQADRCRVLYCILDLETALRPTNYVRCSEV